MDKIVRHLDKIFCLSDKVVRHSDKVLSVSDKVVRHLDKVLCLSDKVVKLSDKDEGLKSENLTPIAPRCKQGGVEIANKK